MFNSTSSKWENRAMNTTDLSDFSAATASDGNFLQRVSGAWTPVSSIPVTGIDGGSVTQAQYRALATASSALDVGHDYLVKRDLQGQASFSRVNEQALEITSAPSGTAILDSACPKHVLVYVDCVVVLPDATTLSQGWDVTIIAMTPTVLMQVRLQDLTVLFAPISRFGQTRVQVKVVCTDNSTSAGVFATSVTPLLDATQPLPTEFGGTGLSAAPLSGQILLGDATGAFPVMRPRNVTAGTGIGVTADSTQLAIENTGVLGVVQGSAGNNQV